MKEIRRGAGQVVISASLDELRLILGALNEALNGPYAIPDDEWIELIDQPPERANELIEQLTTLLER